MKTINQEIKILYSSLFFRHYLMRKQSGFTLIELMVVMAIIAILATAGLSAYTGYIKKARDSKRISDLRAMNTIVIASFAPNGNTISKLDLIDAVKVINNDKALEDPLNGQDVCLDDILATGQTCQYEYYPCDNFVGYTLRAKFESASNAENMYVKNDVGTRLAYYEIANCKVPQLAEGGALSN